MKGEGFFFPFGQGIMALIGSNPMVLKPSGVIETLEDGDELKSTA